MVSHNKNQAGTTKHSVFLMLGSNLGNREQFIKSAEKLISYHIGAIFKRSEIYETEPWGNVNQPSFLNKLLIVETILEAGKVLELVLSIEKTLGRNRTLYDQWKERSIDIDIIYFDDKVFNLKELTIPHPRLHLRNFVLLPLVELASDFEHPILKKSSLKMLNECSDTMKVWKFIPDHNQII